jgi:hypothetical protein
MSMSIREPSRARIFFLIERLRILIRILAAILHSSTLMFHDNALSKILFSRPALSFDCSDSYTHTATRVDIYDAPYVEITTSTKGETKKTRACERQRRVFSRDNPWIVSALVLNGESSRDWGMPGRATIFCWQGTVTERASHGPGPGPGTCSSGSTMLCGSRPSCSSSSPRGCGCTHMPSHQTGTRAANANAHLEFAGPHAGSGHLGSCRSNLAMF